VTTPIIKTLIPVIEYVANTRGFYQKITIQKQIYCVKDQGKKKVTPVKSQMQTGKL
jgi:hypothetical protein